MMQPGVMQPGMDPAMMSGSGMIYPFPRITYTPQAIACFNLYDKDGYCTLYNSKTKHVLLKMFRDKSININEFTVLCKALFRNQMGTPYK